MSTDNRRVELQKAHVRACALDADPVDLLNHDDGFVEALILRIRQAAADSGGSVSYTAARQAVVSLADDPEVFRPSATDPILPGVEAAIALAIERGKEARDRIAYRKTMQEATPDAQIHSAALRLSQKSGCGYASARGTVLAACGDEREPDREPARRILAQNEIRVPAP
jgi:hypothetical protein